MLTNAQHIWRAKILAWKYLHLAATPTKKSTSPGRKSKHSAMRSYKSTGLTPRAPRRVRHKTTSGCISKTVQSSMFRTTQRQTSRLSLAIRAMEILLAPSTRLGKAGSVWLVYIPRRNRSGVSCSPVHRRFVIRLAIVLADLRHL